MPTTLLAGGTGFIGTRLTEMLRERGHTVRILTRHPRGEGQFAWDTEKETIDENAVAGVDFIINLAGAGIADKRWTPARKRELIDSRVKSTHLLERAIIKTGVRLQAFVSSSAIGFYGNSGEQSMHESDLPADQSFMVECCRLWEEAVAPISAMGMRTVIFRTGVVLGKEGGALAELIKPLYFGIGGYFGNGRAWYSWIHLEDICRMYVWALENPEANGIYNAVAPHPARIKPLVQALVRAWRKPALVLPVPAFALRVWFGEMSATILNSNFVSADKIQQAGFTFEHPMVEEAMQSIFQK